MILFSPALTWAVLDDTPRNPLRLTCSHQTSFAASKLYATKVHHPNPFTSDTALHQALNFTPKSFAANNLYTTKVLHQRPLAPSILYTKHLLHKNPFTPFRVNYFNTENGFTAEVLHQEPFTPSTFYTKHL